MNAVALDAAESAQAERMAVHHRHDRGVRGERRKQRLHVRDVLSAVGII
jgi:hypothetical protein